MTEDLRTEAVKDMGVRVGYTFRNLIDLPAPSLQNNGGRGAEFFYRLLPRCQHPQLSCLCPSLDRTHGNVEHAEVFTAMMGTIRNRREQAVLH